MDRISFKINGVKRSVGCEMSSDLTLVDYLRNHLELSGTKYMCREGGCGACIVAASKCPGAPPQAVHSCMVSVNSCQDWEITTIEELGNRKKGYHILQKTLADNNGSQCGHCSPAWVMSMYCLLQKKKDLTMLEIEKSFGGNICRCTGYRPILQAFKKFATDTPDDEKIIDIEDLHICEKTGKNCFKVTCEEDDWCMVSPDELDIPRIIKIKLKDGKTWYRVCQLSDVFKILSETRCKSYMLIFGNTAKGAYPIFEYPRVLIDISSVKELKTFAIDQNLIIGAGLTITELIDKFEITSKENDFEYLKTFIDHLKLVANIPVRNLGSVGGNLMLKHQHNEFPSDLYLLFVTVGAQITILTSKDSKKTLSMKQFLKEDMKGKVILNVLLPPFTSDSHIFTYKIMPRSQNAHAIVNAGFLYKLDERRFVRKSRIVFGGLSAEFTRASKTEASLVGKILFRNETLQAALKVLDKEIVVEELPPEPSAASRKKMALGLFYKGILSLCPENLLNPRFRSGATKIHDVRPVSQAQQTYDTDTTLWPLNQPIPRIDGLIQCAGEAKYAEDMPPLADELYAALVLSTIAVGDIVRINATAALKIPGVIAFYSAKDIPGKNSFSPTGSNEVFTSEEEIFCSGAVKYHSQPIGLIVAETRVIAERAANLVQVTYKNVRRPIIDMKEAKQDPNRSTEFFGRKATTRGNDVAKIITGSNSIYGQFHHPIETLVCVSRPTEEGIAVYSSTHFLNGTQIVISRALNLNCNKIDVQVRRLGGSFGIKISRSILSAVASCLVVQKLNRPCRIIQPLTTTMKAIGKRFPCFTEFEVSVSSKGIIQNLIYKLYEDNGYKVNEYLAIAASEFYFNCYNNSSWNVDCYNLTTDTAKTTWSRAPVSLENIAMAEYLMEQISYEMSLDSLEVRLANLDDNKFGAIRDMANTITSTANYKERKIAVNNFNKQNRWKKRGLRITFMKWLPLGNPYIGINLSVFHEDGSVSIIHGGIDMGQGLNTKAIQVCAYYFKIPIEKIQVKAMNTNFIPNNILSGGSLTSQYIGVAVRKCCEELLLRLEPTRIQMVNPTWEELISKAFFNQVDLQVHGFVNMDDVRTYVVHGVAIAETEVDILTGEVEVRRVDILQDVGRSVSPELDIGQVEGAFIMGQGYWTCEQLVSDMTTGELLTDRTWNYTVPLARDIPQDFRVHFVKNSFSSEYILGSKAASEPPICLSIVVAFAIREAIAAAREDSGIPKNKWFKIDGPYTVAKVCLAAESKIEDFKLY